MSGKKMTTYLGSAAVALALSALVASSSVSARDEDRCKARGDAGGVDVSFNFEWRDRPRADVEIEADPLSGVTVGSGGSSAEVTGLGLSCDFVDPDGDTGDADFTCEDRSSSGHGDLNGDEIWVVVSGGGLGVNEIVMHGACE